jgi:GTP:adenosylcobinamide-phosphate guanylyltransferase
MGGAKHLLEVEGQPMLAHVVTALAGSRAEGITVVLRPGD